MFQNSFTLLYHDTESITCYWAGGMTQRVKVLPVPAWLPVFHPCSPCSGGENPLHKLSSDFHKILMACAPAPTHPHGHTKIFYLKVLHIKYYKYESFRSLWSPDDISFVKLLTAYLSGWHHRAEGGVLSFSFFETGFVALEPVPVLVL